MKNWEGDSPGYSLRILLETMPTKELRTLVDPHLIEVIQAIDPALSSSASSASLAGAVLQLESPEALLEERRTRERLLRHLPLGKAQELLSRLAGESSERPYRALATRFEMPSRDEVELLKNFFGVAKQDSHDVQSVDAGQRSKIEPRFGLFDHQRLTLKAVADGLEKTKSTLLHMPTGSGKTRTAMHLVADHLRRNEESLVFWLSEQPEVLEQAAEAFAAAWTHLGDRAIGIHRVYGSRPVVLEELAGSGFALGGFQKLHSLHLADGNLLLRLGDRTSLVVVDEAHQAIAPTYNSVIRALSRKRPSTRLLGLTATPGRTWSDVDEDYRLSEFFDGRKVSLITGTERNPIRFLVEEGYLADPTFRHLELASDEQEADSQGGIDNARLMEELFEMLGRHSRLLVFGASVPHARLIAAALKYKEIDAGLVTAATPPSEREYLFHRFRRSSAKPMVLVNFGVLTTGFDAPSASGAIIARSTRSLVLFSQMVGRVLRGPRAGGTPTAEVLTTVDTTLPGFGSVSEAFVNWEDVWDE